MTVDTRRSIDPIDNRQGLCKYQAPAMAHDTLTSNAMPCKYQALAMAVDIWENGKKQNWSCHLKAQSPCNGC